MGMYRFRTKGSSVVVFSDAGEEVGRHRTRMDAARQRNRMNGRPDRKPNVEDKRHFRFYTNNRGRSKVYDTHTGMVVGIAGSRIHASMLSATLEAKAVAEAAV